LLSWSALLSPSEEPDGLDNGGCIAVDPTGLALGGIAWVAADEAAALAAGVGCGTSLMAFEGGTMPGGAT
jgi:hypothetical protein